MSSEYIPDMIYPTDNDLEIPCLIPEMQARGCEIPVACFGETRRSYDMNGTGLLHFYTDDYRFSSVYDHPEKILKMNPANIIEPNFSLYLEVPMAFAIQGIYKKRVIARQMQEQGIRVFVDLNVSSKFYKLNMLGVPEGWAAFATRGYSDRLHYLEFEWMIAKNHAGDNRLTFVVYGGGEKVRQWCKSHGAIYVNPVIDMKNHLKRAIKRIEGTISLLAPDQDNKKLIEDTTKNIFDNQVESYLLQIENKSNN